MNEAIKVVRAGLVPYDDAYALQKRLRERRLAEEIGDVLLLLEHPPTYTRGRRATADELPMGVDWYEAQGIEVRDTERGGRVTYHGPEQLVAYPIVALAAYGGDVLAYVRGLEQTMIGALADLGVEAGLIEGETGVWVHGVGGPVVGPGGELHAEMAAKIGSIGLHISRGVTTHGLAVNVANDLQPFEWIVPCGIQGCNFTSVTRERGVEVPVAEYAEALVARYAAIFEREPVAAEVADLDPGAPRPEPTAVGTEARSSKVGVSR